MHKVKNTNDGCKRRKTLECFKACDDMQSASHGDWMGRNNGVNGLGINHGERKRFMLKIFGIGLALSLPYYLFKERQYPEPARADNDHAGGKYRSPGS